MTEVPGRGFRRVADELYRILRGRIIDGTLPAGVRIDIDAIAAEFGVSRTPVREAAVQLEGVGLASRQPYRGTVVTGVDPSRLDEVTALRIQFEGLAAQLGTPRLTAEELERMHEINAEAVAGTARGEGISERFNELNWQFHRTLYAAAAAPMLLRTLDALADEAGRLRIHFQADAIFMGGHQEILDALSSRDAVAARDATRRHLLEAHLYMVGSREIGPILRAVLDDTGIRLEDVPEPSTAAGAE